MFLPVLIFIIQICAISAIELKSSILKAVYNSKNSGMQLTVMVKR